MRVRERVNSQRITFIYLILMAALIVTPYVLTRKTPPGYIIGGDTLVHAAIARGISLGRNPLLDQTYNVYPNWYPFLYHIVIAFVSRGFQISIETAMVLMQLVLAILITAACFYVAESLWGGGAGTAAAALSLMLLTSHLYPNPKELVPLFGVLLVLYLTKEKWALSGVILGLGLWTHYASMFPLLVVPVILTAVLRRREAFIPVLVSLLLFLPFVINVVYHAQYIIPRVEDIYAFWKTDTLSREVRSLIPPLYLIPFLLLSLFKWYKERDFAGTVLLTTIGTMWLLRVSPAILRMFGIQLWSARFIVLLPYMYVLFSAYGLSRISAVSTRMKALFVFTILLLVPVASALNFGYSVEHDRFVWISGYNLSQYFPSEHFVEVSKWIDDNTDRDDVIATSEEAGMMLNALTGRPIVATLYGHGNTFLDNEIRRKAIEMLFTGDCTEKRRVIKEYHVRYIILDPFVYKKWAPKGMGCIARVLYQTGNVTIMEVRG